MSRPIVSRDQLIKAAGKQRFVMGEQSFSKHPVEQFQGSESKASGCISGYQVEIRYRGEILEGACTCPVSEGFDFCHHCVHLTLHANKIAQQLISLSRGPDKSKVLAYLINMDKQVLAKQLLDLIEQDHDLFQRYLLRASLDNAELNYTEIKSRITELTRLKEKLFSQRQVKHFFSRIETLLDELLHFPLESHEDKLLKLIEYATQRLNSLLDQLEDRSNQRQLIVDKLNEMYKPLFGSVNGRPETRAKRFFKTWIDDRHSLLQASSPIIEEDNALHAAFNSLVLAQEKEGSLSPPQKEKAQRYLLDIAIDEEDVYLAQDYRIKLAKKTKDWLDIAQRWILLGELDKAVKILNERLINESDCHPFIKQLVDALEDKDDAITELKQLFEQAPLVSANALFEHAKIQQNSQEVRTFALSTLLKRNEDEERDLRLKLLIEDGQFNEAKELAETFQANIENTIQLARALKDQAPSYSLSFYANSIKQLLNKQLGKADKDAANLLREVYIGFPNGTHLDSALAELKPTLRQRPQVLNLYYELLKEI